MRPFEVAVLIVNSVALIWILIGGTPSVGPRVPAAVAILFLIIHFAVEGQRWQLWSAYLVTVWFVLACTSPRVAQCGALTAVIGLGLLVTATVMAVVLPVFHLPTPTGPFSIGTAVRHLVDSNRAEPHTGRPGTYRELMIQIWYPAEHSGPGSAYRTRSETSFKSRHLTHVKTHAAVGVPVASALSRYPVVIFSPSWMGRRNQNTVQAEELASHGFVVVGIDHPYGTKLTAFPDGRSVETNLSEFLDCSSEEAAEQSVRIANEELSIRTADVRFVLDTVEQLNLNDPTGLLTGRIDIDRVGVLGHSFGGCVAAEVCCVDQRFKAGINLDCLVLGRSALRGIKQPFLFIYGGQPIPTAEALAESAGAKRRYLMLISAGLERVRCSLAAHGGYWMVIDGASHMNFCDSPLISPLRNINESGPIGARRAMKLINEYTVAFFDKHLKQQNECPSNRDFPHYGDVEFKVWPRPTHSDEPLPKDQ